MNGVCFALPRIAIGQSDLSERTLPGLRRGLRGAEADRVSSQRELGDLLFLVGMWNSCGMVHPLVRSLSLSLTVCLPSNL